MNDQEFDWSQLQRSMEEVEVLQTILYDKMEDASQTSDPDVQIDYYHTYYALMEKQQILFTRLRLMKLEELNGIELAIDEYCNALGKVKEESIIEFHLRCKEEAKDALFNLTGENLDDYDGIDIELL